MPPHAERRQRILRVVAGDDAEDTRGVLDRARDGTDAGVDTHLDHTVAAHELLRRRDAYGIVHVRRAADR